MHLNSLIRYFDLQSERRGTLARAQAAHMNHAPVIPQYIALIAGIIAEPFLQQYISQALIIPSPTALGLNLLFGLLIGAAIFPNVYKSAFDPSKPVFVQLCAIFSAGIGWQSLFRAGAHTLGN